MAQKPKGQYTSAARSPAAAEVLPLFSFPLRRGYVFLNEKEVSLNTQQQLSCEIGEEASEIVPRAIQQSEQRRRNGLHSFFLMSGLFVLLCALGLSAAGLSGVLWALGVGFFLVALGPKASPRLLLQMFKARPLRRQDAPAVHELLAFLAARAQLRCALKLYHIPSQGMNAFSVGNNSEATIALTDGLLRKLRASELLAVMAHEISHIRNNDMRVMALADMVSRLNSLLSSIGLLLLLVGLPLFLLGRIFISLPFVLLLILAPALSDLLQLALSRTREYTADLDAVALTGDPAALIDALEKMEVAQIDGGMRRLLSNEGDRLLPSLFRSHPATGERIRRLKKIFAQFAEPPVPHSENQTEISTRLRPIRKPRRHHISGLWY